MKFNLKKGNGLTTPHSQPAKTLTKYTADFIARAARFASAPMATQSAPLMATQTAPP